MTDEPDDNAERAAQRAALTGKLAALTAGDDDRSAVLLFAAISNLLDTFEQETPEAAAAATRSLLMRPAGAAGGDAGAGGGSGSTRRGRRQAIDIAAALPRASVFDDPVFLANARTLMTRRRAIINGVPTKDYPDCVAVGSDTQWCCSGTLIAPNVVVTAGHCDAGGCTRRVLIGPSVDEPGARVAAVQSAHCHPDYRPPTVNTSDLCVLILAEDVDVPPRPMARADMLTGAISVRLAGYGRTDTAGTAGYGVRRMVEVPLAAESASFGADPAIEFVAGAPFLDRDSCNGDSGGPAYVRSGRKEYLVGATSRATQRTFRKCGDGGIYTLIPAFADWIRSVPGGHW